MLLWYFFGQPLADVCGLDDFADHLFLCSTEEWMSAKKWWQNLHFCVNCSLKDIYSGKSFSTHQPVESCKVQIYVRNAAKIFIGLCHLCGVLWPTHILNSTKRSRLSWGNSELNSLSELKKHSNKPLSLSSFLPVSFLYISQPAPPAVIWQAYPLTCLHMFFPV